MSTPLSPPRAPLHKRLHAVVGAVFVQPHTSSQVAGACVFAFLSLLAFERLQPHLSHTDAWMYRIVSSRACVIFQELISGADGFGLGLTVLHLLVTAAFF